MKENLETQKSKQRGNRKITLKIIQNSDILKMIKTLKTKWRKCKNQLIKFQKN